jgi:hypothetical protein
MSGDALDLSVDMLQSLLWQHNHAENLTALLEKKQLWYDQNYTQFWNDWFTDVFNLDTANAFGRQVWARILGIPLQVTLGPQPAKPTWGFGQYNQNFGHGNFAASGGSTIGLTAVQERAVLQLRYLQLISRPTTPEINKMLARVFAPFGPAWVLDGLDMTMTYVFGFQPGSQLIFIFEQYDLLPRPAAVGIDYIVTLRPVWGFDEFHQNFNNGNFDAIA